MHASNKVINGPISILGLGLIKKRFSLCARSNFSPLRIIKTRSVFVDFFNSLIACSDKPKFCEFAPLLERFRASIQTVSQGDGSSDHSLNVSGVTLINMVIFLFDKLDFLTRYYIKLSSYLRFSLFKKVFFFMWIIKINKFLSSSFNSFNNRFILENSLVVLFYITLHKYRSFFS